jgi:CspA family cold shock protein
MAGTRRRPSDESAPVTTPYRLKCAPGRDSHFFLNATYSVRPGMSQGRNPMLEGLEMAIGTVKFFNTTKGFGFIAPEEGGKDVFVHVSAVQAAGLRTLNEGQRVQFDIQPDARGSKAANLKAL